MGVHSFRIRRRMWPYIFVAPFFVIYFLFGLYPVLYSFFLSLTNWNGISAYSFIGFDNYVKLFTGDKLFWMAIKNTLVLALNLPIQIVMAVLLAYMIASKSARNTSLYQTSIFLPYITVPVAIGIIFSTLFAWKGGVINDLLLAFGITHENINWMGYPGSARVTTIIMIIWRNLGFTTLLTLTSMLQVPEDFYDAADIDGANALRKLLSITLPLIRPVMLYILITGTAWTFALFEDIQMLVDGTAVGGPKGSLLTIVWYLFDAAFGRTTRYGYASAIAYGMFIFVSAFTLLSFKLGSRRDPL